MTSRPRITVLTPNPAIDVTYEVPEPALGRTHRITAVSRRAGGKGLNVAAVLSRLGLACRVTGPLGGASGQELRDLLSAWGREGGAAVVPAWVELPRITTRTTVTITARDGTATGLHEPGPTLEQADWEALTRATLRDLDAGDVLAVCGSCPPGTTAEQLTSLLLGARRRGARTIVDTSGPLLAAAAAVCDVVTPNREELLQATGAQGLHEGAQALLGLGAGAVVASDGPRGMLLLASGGQDPRPWHAPAPAVEVVNPTGAGDSAVAALAAELLAHPPAPDGPVLHPRALAAAVALSASAVTTPVAGEVDLSLSHQLLSQIKVVPAHGTD
ncbi:1-phosphofructokinase family hexose kinase [Actinomyces bowdenii]|uniref:1-phosphofructokinase family hexose kinase n=1 Tax=Actinomyces bowdenii TaxID=131109 RepID=A0A3P1V9J5_9ACTO|nr:hexose kinase [Actinomyces bowdenii]RRD30337.1 1-phosphofructokinase family hexose kinase [Actinomyces bowdenii]